MTIEAKARKIIQSLEAKPALFYEILRLVEDEFVIVGPWEHDGGMSWMRHSADRERLAVVEPFGGGSGAEWVWRMAAETKRGFLNADKAKDAVDAHMKKLGYILA
jgi:hypothetical protein